MIQSNEKDVASTYGRSYFSEQFPGSHFQAGCQISLEGQAYVRSKLSYQKYILLYDIEIIPAHVVTPREAYFDHFVSRLTFIPKPSRRFAERHILIALSTAKKTASPLRYTLPGTPSTPNSRPRQRCDQDGRRTNTVNTPCQPKHLLAFTVPARLIRGNIGNPTGLSTDPEKTSKMLGTENLFSQTLQARAGGNSLLNAD